MNRRISIFTIGHSNRPISEFTSLLRENGITLLVDIRTLPGSRHNPQFNAEELEKALAESGIRYIHAKGLGGLRKPTKGSPNTGWKSEGFRGYADYMLTPEFDRNLSRLVELADKQAAAVMCAEAVPWRCHRFLVSDALAARGVEVKHVMGPGRVQAHTTTRFARVEGGRVTYPVPGPEREPERKREAKY